MIRLYFNGAFFCGVALDSSALLATGYGAAQRKVVEALERGAAGEWQFDEVLGHASDMRFSVESKYSSFLPVRFAARGGAAYTASLQKCIETDGLGSEKAEAAFERLGFEVTDADVDLFDVGAGVIGLTVSVSPRRAMTLEELRADVECVSGGLIRALNNSVANTVDAFACALHEALPAEIVSTRPWFQDEGHVGWAPAETAPGETVGLTAPKKLLWLHRTYIFDRCLPGLEDHIEELLPNVFERGSAPNVLFVPGIDSSAICCRQRNADAGLASIRDLLTLMDLQWAYIATLMEIDRSLFRRLNQLTVQGRRTSALLLERESRSVLQLYDRVRLFRATVESVIVDLGGDTRRSWDLIGRVQSLPQISATVGRKLDALRAACESMLAEASAKRQRRIALTVDLFAGFSVIANIATTVAYLTGRDLGMSQVERLLTVGLSTVAVLGALVANRIVRGGGSAVDSQKRRHARKPRHEG